MTPLIKLINKEINDAHKKGDGKRLLEGVSVAIWMGYQVEPTISKKTGYCVWLIK